MKIFSFLLLILCFPLIFLSCENRPDVAEVGKLAPDFTLVDRQGKTWQLSALKGQVVFVNFWATWCPPCREEMPSMQRLYSMLPKDTFQMLAILNKDEPAIADKFAEQFGITIPILDDQANRVGPTYGLTGLPETYIIDKKGVLREKFIGPAQWDSIGIQQMLTKYMKQ